MTIDTQVILKFIETMIKLYDKEKHYTEFDDGKRCGLQLVEAFIRKYEEVEGKRIAQHLDRGA